MASESLCEYKATRKSYVELVAFAKMHCNELCDQLYAADLITKDVLDFVHDRNCLESEKAYKLIDTIVEVFKMVPKTFYEFLTILKRIDGPLISNTVLKLEENLTHEKDLAVKLESSSSSQESSKEEDKFTSSESSYYSAHSNFTDSIKSPDKKSESQDTKELDAQNDTEYESVQRTVSIASSGYESRGSIISDDSVYSQPIAMSYRTLSESQPPRKRSPAFNIKIKPKESSELERSRLMAKTKALDKNP